MVAVPDWPLLLSASTGTTTVGVSPRPTMADDVQKDDDRKA
jgi:hypothetical protein